MVLETGLWFIFTYLTQVSAVCHHSHSSHIKVKYIENVENDILKYSFNVYASDQKYKQFFGFKKY